MWDIKKLEDKAKEALRSDTAKDIAKSAAVGAAIAVPVPLIGPMAGAAIGAGIGFYKNLGKKIDVYAELSKLGDLRQKGIISETEFEVQKKKVLDACT